MVIVLLTFHSCLSSLTSHHSIMSDPNESESDHEQDPDGEWTDPAVRLSELDGDEEEEEQPEPTSVSLYHIFQAFLVPAVIVGVVVLIFIGIRSLFTTGQSVNQLVTRVTSGGGRDQWVAAAQLGKRVQVNKELGNELRETNQLEPLRKELSSTTNEQLQIYLAQILGTVGDRDAAEPIERTLGSTTSAAVKVMLLKALGDIGKPSSSDVIRDHLDTENAAVRQSAVYAAGRLKDRTLIPLLVKRLNDRIPHVKLNAAIALARFDDLSEIPAMRVVQTLLDYLNRENVSRQIQETDFELPSATNHPMWGTPASGEEQKDRNQQIDRMNHVNRMQTSAVRGIRRFLEHHSAQMAFLKPVKSRDRIVNQIRSELRTIIHSSQTTTRPLRAEARKVLSLLKNSPNE